MTYRQKKISKGSNNLELTAIRPGMTLEEVERNLRNALMNSGVQVGGRRSAKKPSQQTESPQTTMEQLMEEGLTKEQAARVISDTLL